MSDAEDLPLASLTSVIELLGPYAIERELGGGATGRVLACKDQDLGRDVAIKILHEDLLHDDVAVARFKREGQVLAKIDSPNVVRVFQVGVHGKAPYIVMERVDGEDAERALRAHGAMPLVRVLAIARDVARGLSAVHAAGVLHRDVKPSNILLSSSGAKLGDFGLAAQIEGSAQLTQAGTIPGTAATMAPERLRNQCDARSDLYALGCTLYALATATMPFERASAIEVLAAHAHEPAPRLALEGGQGAAFSSLVDRLLYKDPDKRPQSADEVVRLVDEIESMPARKLAQEKRDALANKIETLLGPDGEIPKIPEVPRVDELVPPEPASAPPAPVLPVEPPPTAATEQSTTDLAFASAVLVAPPQHVEASASPTAPRASVLSRLPRRTLLGIGAGVAALLLVVTLALVLGGPSSAAGAFDIDDVAEQRERIDAGDAELVLAELRTLKDNTKPVHALIRGHALVATGANEAALASYLEAARGKLVDARALEHAVAALEVEDAKHAKALLLAWPSDEVVARLVEVIESGDWWARHHALAVLDERKESDRVDVTALGVRDLNEGASCNKRKHGLTLLKERGHGKEALAAIDRAQRRGDNGCIWFGDWEAAKRAVRAR